MLVSGPCNGPIVVIFFSFSQAIVWLTERRDRNLVRIMSHGLRLNACQEPVADNDMGRKYGKIVTIASPHGIVIPSGVELANPLNNGDMQIDPLFTFFPQQPSHEYTRSCGRTFSRNG
jgi:hypothetical protein